MLPLWIIDINGSDSRREAFLSLVRKMDHVYVSQECSTVTLSADGLEEPAGGGTVAANATPQTSFKGAKAEEVFYETQLSQEELLKEEDRRTAERNAIINGDYWYYSAFDDTFRGVDLSSEESIDCEGGVAERLYAFQEQLVKAGKDFILTLRKSNVKPYQTINVVVLGDSTEKFSQTVFPSIAAILQKEKGRFLPAHIHQGMSIYGALYVPCDINTKEASERNRVLRLLNEVEVQHNVKAIRGYDHVMLYQNVQNRTECSYPMLDEKGLSEYLLQCLVHLFYACDYTHPLISGTGSEDSMYFSMGATSLYFDMEVEDANDANKVASEFVKQLKKESDVETLDRDEMYLLERELFDVKKFISEINAGLNLELQDANVDDPVPHPILNYKQKSLKRLYYFYYLRYFPAKLLRKISDNIEKATSSLLDRISIRSTKMYKACEMAMLPAITRVISKVNKDEGALATIDGLLVQLQEKMSTERERIREELEHCYWDTLIASESSPIPRNQLDYFETYHDAYLNDVKSRNGGAGQMELKDQATEKLQKLLSSERTMLATVGRAFLLGVMCVLAVLPILNLLSPTLINLGNIKEYAFFWAIALLVLPALIQLGVLFFYLRKKNACVRVLKAYYSHDAYARVANRIEFEAADFYSKMTTLCDEYIKRNKCIREQVIFQVPDLTIKMPFPLTQFNQPISGGTEEWAKIIPPSEIEGCRIRINYNPEYIADLTDKHYYMLINRFNDEISVLYRDVKVLDDHTRRINETTHEYEFISKDQLLQEQEACWTKNKALFRDLLLKGIMAEMLPRENPSVGEKLIQYKRKTGKLHCLDDMIAYAAANGEIICESDSEYADVKINKNIDDLLRSMPMNVFVQGGEFDELYKKCLFITRWRSFDHFSYNRILPTEDFDQEIREQLVASDEEMAKKRKALEEARRNGQKIDEQELEAMRPSEYKVCISALILWAICPDDTSTEWMKLFEPEFFVRAYEDRWKIRKIMNQED